MTRRCPGAAIGPAMFLLLVANALSQQPRSQVTRSGAYSVSGTVVDHRSGSPLGNATVMLTAVVEPPIDQGPQQANEPLVYVTGADGQFVFENLPAGKYSVSAQARGFDFQGFRENDGYATAIATGPGFDSEHTVFPLIASASISGSVVDEEGDPVRQAQLFLFYRGISSGRSQTTQRGGQQTDSAGNFHFGHLPPGTYFVAVQARPWYAENQPLQPVSADGQASTAPSDLDVAYPITYYGDTDDPTAAAPIAVAEGGSATIQVTLRAVPALHLELSENVANGWANVSAKGLGGFGLSPNVTMSITNGHAEISGLAPGNYDVTLQTNQDGQVHSFGTKSLNLTSSGAIDVGSPAKTSISGQIRFEGRLLPDPTAQVLLQGLNQNTAAMAPINKDGTFTIKDYLAPGRYQARLINAPGVYLKSIEAKGAKFSAGELEIGDGASVQLSLTAAGGLTHVKGIALNDGKPFAGAMVLLVPRDLNRTDLIRRDQSDADGTFNLYDVAPGDYRLIAIDDGHDLAYQESSVLAPYLNKVQHVTIPLESPAELKVEVVPRRP